MKRIVLIAKGLAVTLGIVLAVTIVTRCLVDTPAEAQGNGVFGGQKWITTYPGTSACPPGYSCLYSDNKTGFFVELDAGAQARIATTADISDGGLSPLSGRSPVAVIANVASMDAATPTSGGYMLGSDKARLDNIQDAAAALADTAPNSVGTANAVGTANVAAPFDHTHANNITVSPPLATAASTASVIDIRYAAAPQGSYPVAQSDAAAGTAMQLGSARTVFNCDLTVQSNQTFSVADTADHDYAICGITMTTSVSASTVTGGVTTWDVSNGNGIRAIPGAGNVNNKDLKLRFPLSAIGLNATNGIRMWTMFTTSGETAPTASGAVSYAPRILWTTTGLVAGAVLIRTTDTAGSSYTQIINNLGTSANTTGNLNITIASYDVYVLDLTASGVVRAWRGTSSGGDWPAVSALVWDAGNPTPVSITSSSSLQGTAADGQLLPVRTLNTSAETPSHIYKRIRVDAL